MSSVATVKKIKRQPRGWKKIFASHKCDKGVRKIIHK